MNLFDQNAPTLPPQVRKWLVWENETGHFPGLLTFLIKMNAAGCHHFD
ncbi:MAG: hypothetical protein WBV94_08710 [Blastocatellia bacterium]